MYISFDKILGKAFMDAVHEEAVLELRKSLTIIKQRLEHCYTIDDITNLKRDLVRTLDNLGGTLE